MNVEQSKDVEHEARSESIEVLSTLFLDTVIQNWPAERQARYQEARKGNSQLRVLWCYQRKSLGSYCRPNMLLSI